MKLAWVRGFVAVADAGGFAEAAEQLFTTQSTVSKQIQSLEKELGVTLFDRTGRKAALSPAGRALLPHARRLLREEQALRAKPDENSGVAWFAPEEAVAASTEPDMRVIYEKLNGRLFAEGE